MSSSANMKSLDGQKSFLAKIEGNIAQKCMNGEKAYQDIQKDLNKVSQKMAVIDLDRVKVDVLEKKITKAQKGVLLNKIKGFVFSFFMNGYLVGAAGLAVLIATLVPGVMGFSILAVLLLAATTTTVYAIRKYWKKKDAQNKVLKKECCENKQEIEKLNERIERSKISCEEDLVGLNALVGMQSLLAKNNDRSNEISEQRNGPERE